MATEFAYINYLIHCTCCGRWTPRSPVVLCCTLSYFVADWWRPSSPAAYYMYFLVEGVETTFACRNCCTHYIYSSGLVGTEFAFSTLLTIIYFLVEGEDNVRLNYLLYTFYFLVDLGRPSLPAVLCSTMLYTLYFLVDRWRPSSPTILAVPLGQGSLLLCRNNSGINRILKAETIIQFFNPICTYMYVTS